MSEKTRGKQVCICNRARIIDRAGRTAELDKNCFYLSTDILFSCFPNVGTPMNMRDVIGYEECGGYLIA